MPVAKADLDAQPGEIRVYSAPVVGRDNHQFAQNADGSRTILGLEIFKAGTFRDSLGDTQTWTDAHLEQMVFHFDLLRKTDVFPNVPFRADHSWSVDKVIGYIDNLYAQGGKLVADVNVTEPAAFDKFERGTYRSRSLEVGMYGTNAEEFYYPVVMGCAFVDIPAVEGLHRNGQPVKAFAFSSTPPKEPDVPDPTPAPATFAFRIGDATETDYAKVQAHIDGLTTQVATLGASNADLLAQVAAHDDFKKGVRDGERTAFVTGLAAAGKIAQPQVESLTALAVGMTDEQFDGLKASYEHAPKLSILGQHAGLPTGSPDPLGGDAGDRKDVLETMIAQHRRAGLSEDEIVKTASYRELQTLVGAH